MERKQERIEALLTAADRLGRKFEATDLQAYPRLLNLASDWLVDLPRPTEPGFLADMWAQVNGGQWLTNGQAKGVLNTIVARERRVARTAARATVPTVEAAPAREVPIGTFTVVGVDAAHITIRLQLPQDNAKRAEGVVYAKYLNGADNDVDFQYFATVVGGRIMARGYERQVAALKVVLGSSDGDLGAMGLAYAMASSNCWRCGRTLTVPASIHSGMGPDCAAKVGAKYSEPEAPSAPEDGDGPEQEGLGYTERDDEARDEMERQDTVAPRNDRAAQDARDAENAAANRAMWAKKASGRKLTYADIFGED